MRIANCRAGARPTNRRASGCYDNVCTGRSDYSPNCQQ
jgi:hypothetical protein